MRLPQGSAINGDCAEAAIEVLIVLGPRITLISLNLLKEKDEAKARAKVKEKLRARVTSTAGTAAKVRTKGKVKAKARKGGLKEKGKHPKRAKLMPVSTKESSNLPKLQRLVKRGSTHTREVTKRNDRSPALHLARQR